MLDFLIVTQHVREIVVLATGMKEETVILANQDGPRPTQTFATVNIIGEQTRGQGYVKGTETDVKFGVGGNYRDLDLELRRPANFTASVNFYGERSKSYAGTLQQANKRVHVDAYMMANNLGWLRAGGVRDLTDIEFGRYFRRAQIDLDMMVMDTAVDTVQQIYEVPFKVISEDGENLYDIEVIRNGV
jgi:hypothetical protein